MKKTLIAFLCTFIALPAMADNYIKFKASAIEDTINTMVPESHRASAADEYQKQMNSTTGKISVMGIYKVCAAAGFNINNTNGYNGCCLFINTIAEKSGFGFGSANQQKCKTKFNGIWALSPDGKQYQCVGKDGYKLVYHASCNGAGGDCIRDFSSLQTQEPNAREFIQTYGQQKNLQFTCWYTFDESRWQINNPKPQDYIKCSAGGKAYEFEFDDLIQDPGKTAVESENTALCEMFGGKIVKHPDSSIEKQWQSCEVSREICNGLLHNLAVKIGHNVMYQGYCRLSRTVKETSVVGLKTLPGVDSRIFYNTGAQMRAGMAKQQTEEYLRTKFPNETYVNCNPNPKILNAGLGIDTDYVMTCTVGSKQVDFIFHDLTEGNYGRAATGMDAMQCIISGGTFKGESCRGPTQAECDALDAALRAKGSSEGAKWDDNVRACIMGNAMKTYKRDVTTGYIVGAVVIVGGTIAVIGTGGAAAPAIIGGAEMLVTDLAINWAIDANHRRLSKGAATRFVNFIEDADKCTTEACALKVLQSHYATLSGVMNDLNKDDLAVVDTTMERLFGLIQTEFMACGKNDVGQTVYANPADCAMQQSHLKIMDYIDPVSEPVLIIASIAYNPGYVTNKFMKLKKVRKLAKLDDAADAAVVAGSKIKNPKQWKPGEDVAEYMDVEKLQSKLDDIDNQHAAYLDELNTQLQDAEIRLSQTPKKTDAQSETAKIVEGQIDKRIEQLVAQEMDDFEEYNRIKNEFALQRKKITSEHREELIEILKEKGTTGLEDAINKYADSPEFTALSQRHKELSDKYRQIDHKIRLSSDDAELLKLKTEHEALVHGNSPEYNEVSNEIEYINALMEDTYKTIGDEKNVALWDAIPNEIKQKLPEIRDNEIVEILAKDDMLTHYVNNFDEVSKNAELYNDFLSRIARGINDKHPMSIPVSIGTYTDANSPRIGALAQPIDNSIGINTARRNDTDLDGTIGIIKHEVGHSIDHHRANDGILGQTLQDMKTWKNHGNSDPDIMNAISPSGLNEFSVGDISKNARKQLESEGWKFENISTPETREKYLAEPTEKSSWSITPTSNIKQKVNSYREANGVTK